MHEFSLATSLIDQILDLAKEHQASRVLCVRVTIGPFYGIVRESFEFGFNVLKESRPLTAGALLELETPDPTYVCLDCARVSMIPFALPGETPDLLLLGPFPKKCPWCGGRHLSPKGGTELILNQVEME
ncbi:MAG: hydrogenase maturation nickel metallochaperone HypA [Desulfobulbus sp.]|jgi:hydrogenase nickel incorporation protein HypA/HybF|nr:hydrogenase maturation nickel metallochaperone HypA [Desulfobulbus sp.]